MRIGSFDVTVRWENMVLTFIIALVAAVANISAYRFGAWLIAHGWAPQPSDRQFADLLARLMVGYSVGIAMLSIIVLVVPVLIKLVLYHVEIDRVE